ncbi:MAG: hypothetical protein JNN13_01720 [Planctomycetes bacterium]|nr:hypothetical protein [Planctomycetota bacterium]
MNIANRCLLALLLALGLVLPSVSSEGGENGLGIWILPNANHLTSGIGCSTTSAPRASQTFAVGKDITMDVASGMGAIVATFVDELAGQAISLPVVGGRVTIPGELVEALTNSASPRASIVIADACQLGYVLTLACDPAANTITVGVQ